jgi:hypothetical protein
MGKLQDICIKDHQPDFEDSDRRGLLKYYRFIMTPLHTFFFLYFILFYKGSFFLYLTHWGIFLTFIYFLIGTLSYQSKSLKPICYIIFETIWPINLIITVLFWVYFFPLYYFDSSIVVQLVFGHTFPVLSGIIDFFLNRVVVYRSHYVFPLAVLVFYVLAVLLPYTVGYREVYIGINFVNAITYVIFIIAIILLIVSLEIARYIRLRSCKDPLKHSSLAENSS